MRVVKRTIQSLLARLGYAIVRKSPMADIDAEFFALSERCRPYTMTSFERMYALYNALQYVVGAGIPGDIVECGVWKGGSAMLAALTLLRMEERSRQLVLYDTYSGWPEPSARDVDYKGLVARDEWRKTQGRRFGALDYAPIDEVRENLRSTGYPEAKLTLVQGKVEETIPGTAPAAIALLRLDTDWYESTSHELRHLYPRLAPGGVLLIDDYGHTEGARDATNDYFQGAGARILLNRIDYSGRIGVKR